MFRRLRRNKEAANALYGKSSDPHPNQRQASNRQASPVAFAGLWAKINEAEAEEHQRNAREREEERLCRQATITTEDASAGLVQNPLPHPTKSFKRSTTPDGTPPTSPIILPSHLASSTSLSRGAPQPFSDLFPLPKASSTTQDTHTNESHSFCASNSNSKSTASSTAGRRSGWQDFGVQVPDEVSRLGVQGPCISWQDRRGGGGWKGLESTMKWSW